MEECQICDAFPIRMRGKMRPDQTKDEPEGVLQIEANCTKKCKVNTRSLNKTQ